MPTLPLGLLKMVTPNGLPFCKIRGSQRRILSAVVVEATFTIRQCHPESSGLLFQVANSASADGDFETRI
jgi:hypothetical protein